MQTMKMFGKEYSKPNSKHKPLPKAEDRYLVNHGIPQEPDEYRFLIWPNLKREPDDLDRRFEELWEDRQNLIRFMEQSRKPLIMPQPIFDMLANTDLKKAIEITEFSLFGRS